MNMSNEWLDQNSGGSGNPGVFFDKVGAKVVGRINGTPHQTTTQYGERLVIEIAATAGSTALKGDKGSEGPISEGEEVTLWIKPGSQAGAVRDALKTANAAGLQDGGTLAVLFSDTKDIGKADPVKIYTAQYLAPVPAVAVSDSLI